MLLTVASASGFISARRLSRQRSLVALVGPQQAWWPARSTRSVRCAVVAPELPLQQYCACRSPLAINTKPLLLQAGLPTTTEPGCTWRNLEDLRRTSYLPAHTATIGLSLLPGALSGCCIGTAACVAMDTGCAGGCLEQHPLPRTAAPLASGAAVCVCTHSVMMSPGRCTSSGSCHNYCVCHQAAVPQTMPAVARTS